MLTYTVIFKIVGTQHCQAVHVKEPGPVFCRDRAHIKKLTFLDQRHSIFYENVIYIKKRSNVFMQN